MTRTEDDLRTLLRAPVDVGSLERVQERLLVDVTPPARRRRPLRIAAVAALSLVVVAAVVVAVVGDRPAGRTAPQPPVASTAIPTATTSPSTPSLPVGAFVASVGTASGYSVYGESSTTTEQQLAVFSDDTERHIPVARLYVSLSGTRSDPPIARAPVRLLDGSEASWVSVTGSTPSVPAFDALQWDVATDLTLTVAATYDGDTDSTLVGVASAIRIGGPVPVPVPFRVPSLPAGWTYTGLTVATVYCCVFMTEGQVHVTATFTTPDAGGVGGAVVEAVGAAWANMFTYAGTPVEIDGRTWHWDANAGTLTWRGTDRSIRLSNGKALGGAGSPTVTEDDLADLARSLVQAPSYVDETTWFDATAAFPS